MGFYCCDYGIPMNLILLLSCLCFGGVGLAGGVVFIVWLITRQNKSEPTDEE
jgi:hypothetical protein